MRLRSAWLVVVALGASAAALWGQPGDGAVPPGGDVEDALALASDAYGRGEIAAAANAFWRAGELAEATGDETTAAAAFNNASVLWNESARYDRALAAAERALALRAGAAPDAALARTLNSRGLSHLNLGQYDAAATSFREALATNRSLGEAEGEVVNHTNLAIVAERRGEFHLAARELARALDLLARQATEPWVPPRRAAAMLNLGVLRERLGDYRGALEVLSPLEREGAFAGSAREQAVLLQNLAVVYRNLGDPGEATDRLRSAEALYGSSGDGAGAAGVRLNLGIVRYLDLADAVGALQPLGAAVDSAARLGERGLEAEALFHLGRAHFAAGDRAASRAALERSLAVAEAAGAQATRWQALWGLGLLDEADGDPARALANLTAAMDAVDGMRSRLEVAGDRGAYFADKRVVYAAAVRLLAGGGAGADAGTATERASQRATQRATEQALAIAWRAKARLLLDEIGDPEPGSTAPPAFASVQQALRREVLVEYFLADGRLYRFVVDASGVVLAERGAAAPVLAAVRTVHGRLAAGEEPSPASLATLSETLLGGAWRGEPPRRLAIAGDGLLRYLPFELLAVAPGGEPLVESTTVRYLPSGAFLAGGHGRTAELVVRGYAASQPAALAAPWLARPLAELTTARAEVEGAARALGGRAALRLGAEATETAFRADAPTPARLLHVAAHALLAEDRGGDAAMVFAAGDGNDEDGLLHATELADLRLDVGVAVLSACSTTLGVEDDARALESLAGAFLTAGARGVVATLWDVADPDAAAFVEALAWELGRGRDVATALRRVKLRFRADPRWQDESRWAGWVLLGDSAVVRPEKLRWRRLLTAGALAAALLGGVAAALAARRRAQGQSRKVSVSSSGRGS